MNKTVFNFKIIAIILAIPLLIILLLIINQPRLPKDGTNIENLAEYDKNIPVTKRNLVLQNLYQTIKLNLKENEIPPTRGAKIRANTFKTETDRKKDYTNTSFIVDIDSLHQSYLVQYHWSNNPKNPDMPQDYPELTSCLSNPDDAIYPEFICKDTFRSGKNAYEIISNYLPYFRYKDPKVKNDPGNTVVYNAFYRIESSGKPYIELIVVTNNDPLLEKKYIEEFHNWIKFQGVNPTDLDIRTKIF